jgi:hypothetical protein
MFMFTGQTFGDNTSPSNWEPVARSRQQLARYLWKQPDTVAKAAKYLPPLQLATAPTPAEVATFVQATADTKHKGVMDESGNRLPPQYNHHVDDCFYGDIGELVPLGISASILALYTILAHPSSSHKDPVSWDKFEAKFTHRRKAVGFDINSRTLDVSLPDYKRAQFLSQLALWLANTDYSLLEAAELLGTFNNLTTICRWARPRFFALQNAVRRAFVAKYHATVSWYMRSKKPTSWTEALPPHLHKRIDQLVARDIANVLWRTKARLPITAYIRSELTYVHDYLSVPTNTWKTSIGHLIIRDAMFPSTGDASLLGSGFASKPLEFWFAATWSAEIRRRVRLNSKHPDYIHINCLEFVTVILQLAACITRLELDPYSALPLSLRRRYPNGIPALPTVVIWTDNTPSKRWANKVTTASPMGQTLVQIFGELLRRSDIAINCDWIAGVDNVRADMLSCPDLSLTPLELYSQIYRKEPQLRSWNFFRPSPELVSLLGSRLLCTACPDPPVVPATLGRFEAEGFTTTSSVTI